MKITGIKALALLATVFLFGCQAEFTSLENNSNYNANNGNSFNPIITNPQVFGVDYENPNPTGKALYDQQCVNCHLDDGSGPTGASLISCATCGNLASLSARIETTMPPANAQAIEGADAQAIAEYVIAKFNYVSANQNTGSTNIIMNDISTVSPPSAAYKIAFAVKGELPNDDEVQQFSAQQNTILDRWLNSEGFYSRLMTIYNQAMQTDSYHSRFERETSYVNLRDRVRACQSGQGGTCNGSSSSRTPYYENVIWWDDLKFEGLLADLTNDAFTREPLELIRHVAKNNLPFSEILTADYTMVNAFSARAYTPKNLDGSNVSIAQFKEIPTPLITDDEGVEQVYLAPFQEVLRDLNQLRGSDVQYNAGNSEDRRTFLETYNQDPRDYIPAKLTQDSTVIPHAGILTTKAFLNKFTTTPTNMHRARARWVYQLFAATDILAIEGNRDASLVDFSDSTGAMDPTKTNEDCLVCHRRIDPVADAFKNWTYNGNYSNANCSMTSNINQCATKPGVGIGFEGVVAPIFGNNSVDAASLQWLAQSVSENPLFAKSVAHILFKGFTGDDVLPLDREQDNRYQNDYQAQQKVIAAAIQAFNANGQNVKAAAKTILLSPYFLANQSVDHFQVAGADKLLTPDELQQKLFAVSKHIWSYNEVDDAFKMQMGNRSSWRLYGGASGITTTQGPDEQGSVMNAIQERMANEMACFITAQELSRPNAARTWLDNLTFKTTLANSEAVEFTDSEQNLRKTFAKMHLVFWHQEVGVNSPEVDLVIDLFNKVSAKGLLLRANESASRDLAGHCRVDYHPDTNLLLDGDQRVYRDEFYKVRALSAITNYFLNDYRFSHQ